MLASDLIEDLRELISRHGDLQVVDDQDHQVGVEFNDDDPDADAVFVVS
jgi:hypothetical protein